MKPSVLKLLLILILFSNVVNAQISASEFSKAKNQVGSEFYNSEGEKSLSEDIRRHEQNLRIQAQSRAAAANATNNRLLEAGLQQSQNDYFGGARESLRQQSEDLLSGESLTPITDKYRLNQMIQRDEERAARDACRQRAIQPIGGC